MSDFHLVAAFIVGTLAVARINRLIVWDTYPPVAHLRAWWDGRTGDSSWNELLHCGYCFGVWASGAQMVAVGLQVWLLGELHWVWWAVNIWLAMAYLSAIVMAYDGDD